MFTSYTSHSSAQKELQLRLIADVEIEAGEIKMKMKPQGAKLNNCATFKEIKRVSWRNLGDFWAWMVTGVLQHSPEKHKGALQLST